MYVNRELLEELYEYYDSITKEIYDFSPSLNELVRKTSQKGIELIKNDSPQEEDKELMQNTINRLTGNIIEEISYIKEDLKTMNIEYNSVKKIIERIYSTINGLLPKLEEMIDKNDIKIINRKAAKIIEQNIYTEFKQNNNINKMVSVTNYFVNFILTKYLTKVEQLTNTKTIIKNQWYAHIINEYYGDPSNEGTLEQKIITQVIAQTQEEWNWRGELLKKMTQKEENNILLDNFSEWYQKNHENLYISFYNWDRQREKAPITFPSFITIALIDSMTLPTTTQVLTKSQFKIIANNVIQMVKNDNLKKIFYNINETNFKNYERMLSKEIEHYISYLKNQEITHNFVNEFATSISKLFLNQFNDYYIDKIKIFDKQNNDRLRFSEWLVKTNIELKKFFTSTNGLTDHLYGEITEEKINNIFSAKEFKQEDIGLTDTRIAYKLINNSLIEIIKRKGERIKDLKVINEVLEKNNNLNNRELAEEFIKKSWEKIRGEKA